MAEIPLVLKLASFMDVTPGEKDRIKNWCANSSQLNAGATVIHQGAPTNLTCLMLSGWGYRFKDLYDGHRIIVGLLLPGDMCDLHGFLLDVADHGLAMLSDAVVALIPSDKMTAGIDLEPRLGKALWWSSLVDESITREWLVNVSQRSGPVRLAHLFCEIWMRARRVGLTDGGTVLLPLKQIDLADALGLTPVHISRVLRSLREQGLVEMRPGQLVIPDPERLAMFADFDPAYLQMKQSRR